MFDPQSIAVLTSFFTGPKCNTGFTINRALGLVTGYVAGSAVTSEDQLLNLLFDDMKNLSEKPGKNGEMSEMDELYFEWSGVLIEIQELLETDQFRLSNLYPPLPESATLPNGLADWCTGYLQGFKLSEESWQIDWDLSLPTAQANEAQALMTQWQRHLTNVIELTDLIITMGKPNPLQTLDGGVTELMNRFDRILSDINSLVSQLKPIKRLYDSYAHREQLMRSVADAAAMRKTQTVKVGRNDPCPCGSGKKYKKCCG